MSIRKGEGPLDDTMGRRFLVMIQTLSCWDLLTAKEVASARRKVKAALLRARSSEYKPSRLEKER